MKLLERLDHLRASRRIIWKSRWIALGLAAIVTVTPRVQASDVLEPSATTTNRMTITVAGAVKSPGEQQFPSNEKLMLSLAIIRAGGGSIPGSDFWHVKIIRKKKARVFEETTVNIYEFLAHGTPATDVELKANDLIFVPEAGASTAWPSEKIDLGNNPLGIIVTGAVQKPGMQPFPADEKYMLSKAIIRAGGGTSFAYFKEVRIVRQKGDGIREIIRVNVQEMLKANGEEKDVELEANDLVIVPEQCRLGPGPVR